MKAVILAAWLWTRTLPITKTIPKELLPVGDKPIIQYTIEWLVAAWIDDIVIISSQQKKALEDYFDKNYELEDVLQKQGKLDLLALINTPKHMARYTFVKQFEPLGTWHAVQQVRHLISDEYFMVILADTIYPPETFVDMKKAFDAKKSPLLAIHEVPRQEVYKYGIVWLDGTLVTDFVEKPKVEDAPSNSIWNGVAILPKRIFELLENIGPSATTWELYLTDAVKMLLQETSVHSLAMRPFLDTGSIQWWLEANEKFLRKGKLFD